jgi:hypothetical protein
MMAAQLEEERGRGAANRAPDAAPAETPASSPAEPAWVERAREALRRGVDACPLSSELWRCAASLELRARGILRGLARARSLLELGRRRLPRDAALWCAAIRTERAAARALAASDPVRRRTAEGLAAALAARALRPEHCPRSGAVWAEAVEMTDRKQQKRRCADALRACGGEDAEIVLAVARLFWRQQPPRTRKARKWLERALAQAPRSGDAWAARLQFALETVGEGEAAESVRRRCAAAEPNRGEIWCRFAKSRRLRRAGPRAVLEAAREAFRGGGADYGLPES